MIIRTMDEYLKLKRELKPELRNKDAFKTNYDVYVEDMLHQGIPLDVEILDDGRKIKITEDARIYDYMGRKEASIKVLESSLMEDNSIEIIKSTGNIMDADYYNSCHMDKVPKDSTSVISTFYDRQEFDPEDIEVIRTNYSKAGYPLKDVRYDNINALKDLLLSSKHRPVFDGSGVKLPDISNCAVVESYGRVGNNPAFAMYHRYERGKSNNAFDRTPTTYSIGVISHEWPEMLRVNSFNVFADRIEGEWKVRKDSFYGEETFEGALRRASLEWESLIEESMSKKHNLKEYGVIKSRMEEANKQYKLSKEEKQKTLTL